MKDDVMRKKRAETSSDRRTFILSELRRQCDDDLWSLPAFKCRNFIQKCHYFLLKRHNFVERHIFALLCEPTCFNKDYMLLVHVLLHYIYLVTPWWLLCLASEIWSMSKRKPWLFQHFADFFNPKRYFFESLGVSYSELQAALSFPCFKSCFTNSQRKTLLN